MTYEKIATPKRRMKAQMNLSMLLFGWQSPKPTVDRDVNAKYTAIIMFSLGVLYIVPY
jgi:hypothetical protein